MLYIAHEWTITLLTSVPVISLLAVLHPSVSFVTSLYVCMPAVFSSAWRSRVGRELDLCFSQEPMAQSGQSRQRKGWEKTRHMLSGGWVMLAVIVLEPDHLDSVDVTQICNLELRPSSISKSTPLPLQPFYIHSLFQFSLCSIDPANNQKILLFITCRQYVCVNELLVLVICFVGLKVIWALLLLKG